MFRTVVQRLVLLFITGPRVVDTWLGLKPSYSLFLWPPLVWPPLTFKTGKEYFFCQHIFTVIKNFISGLYRARGLYHLQSHQIWIYVHFIWLQRPFVFFLLHASCECKVGRSHIVHSCSVHWQGNTLCIRTVLIRDQKAQRYSSLWSSTYSGQRKHIFCRQSVVDIVTAWIRSCQV